MSTNGGRMVCLVMPEKCCMMHWNWSFDVVEIASQMSKNWFAKHWLSNLCPFQHTRDYMHQTVFESRWLWSCSNPVRHHPCNWKEWARMMMLSVRHGICSQLLSIAFPVGWSDSTEAEICGRRPRCHWSLHDCGAKQSSFEHKTCGKPKHMEWNKGDAHALLRARFSKQIKNSAGTACALMCWNQNWCRKHVQEGGAWSTKHFNDHRNCSSNRVSWKQCVLKVPVILFILKFM